MEFFLILVKNTLFYTITLVVTVVLKAEDDSTSQE